VDADVNNPKSAETQNDAKKRASHTPLKVAKSFNIKVRLNFKVIINLQTRWTKTKNLLNSIQANKTRKIGRKSSHLRTRFQANNEFQLQAQPPLTDVLRTLILGSQLVRDKPSLETRHPAIFKIKSSIKASHRTYEPPRVYMCRSQTTRPVR
jgi:hypothetical protein